MSAQVVIAEDAAALVELVAVRLAQRVSELAHRGPASVALTGGTIAGQIYRSLRPDAAPWGDIDYYWGDERCVPLGHGDRNDREALEAFLGPFGVATERIHPMPAEDPLVPMEDAAANYARTLPVDGFGLTLLGVGPDGHVASLFPGFDQLEESARSVVAVTGAPKPPPNRFSLTFAALNSSQSVWLLVSGEAKAAAVAEAVDSPGALPASRVHGIEETVWFLDQEAASGLPER